MTSSNVCHLNIFHIIMWIQAWAPLNVTVYFREGTLLSQAILSFLQAQEFSVGIYVLHPHILSQYSAWEKMIHFLLFVSPTNWPCEVLIVPEWLHSRPIISHKSTKGGRTSDRWLSYCLLIAGVYLLIIFCIPHRSRNLYSGGMDQTQWGFQFPLS